MRAPLQPGRSGRAAGQDGDVFSPAVAVWMIAAALVSGAAFVALLAFAPRPVSGAYLLSRSAVGYAALVRLLRAEGVPVRINAVPDLSRAPAGVLVLTPDVGRPLSALPRTPLGHVTLIVAPKWMNAPWPRHRGWVFRFGPYPPAAVTSGVLDPLTGVGWAGVRPSAAAAPRIPPPGRRGGPIRFEADPFLVRRADASSPVLQGAGGFFPPGTRIRLARIEQLQAFSRLPSGWEPGLVDEQGRTVIAFDRRRRLFVLSDPDLFNTQGLATQAGAEAASRIVDGLRSGGDPVVFDLTLSGVGADARQARYNILRLVLTPPFLSATLCGVAAALLMGLNAAVRFGPAQRPGRVFALGKRALADNSAALIHMARRDAAMAPRYAALSRALAVEGLQLGRSLDASANARLDRIGAARGIGTPFSELERDAARVADGAALMAAARALYRWRLEMTRGR